MPEPLPPRLRLAADHFDAGRLEQAHAALQRFLASEPHHSVANAIMGSVLSRRGEPERALFHLNRAAAGDPDNPDLLANLANAQLSLGQSDLASATYRRGLSINASHLSCTVGLIGALNARAQLDEAATLARAALQRHPEHRELLINHAATLLNSGRSVEAVSLLQMATRLHPDDPVAAGSLAFAMNYPDGIDASDVAAAHLRYGTLLNRSTRRLSPAAQGPDRKLRIGILSADLRAHSVAFFIEPWFECHDRSSFELVVYSTSLKEDQTSQRLKSLISRWRAVPHLPAPSLADQVRDDRIDILLDLSGHTAGHRLPVLHMRPAPLQATYLGYPGTTGLSQVDLRIVDALTDPGPSPGTELLHRLGRCFLCYCPDPQAPPISAAPHSGITFGSFSALSKLTDTAVHLWASVVRQTPGSTLMLKADALGQPGVRAHTAARFTSAGIAANRLELMPASPSRVEHLSRYAEVDIALDTFPYNGATTTCEALYMGVPVVSLAGQCHAARVGVSLLSAAGLPHLIADTHEDYVRIATELAAQGTRRVSAREALRSQLLQSPVCNKPDFARHFDAALRGAWRRTCAAR